jgi:hypothetical protein
METKSGPIQRRAQIQKQMQNILDRFGISLLLNWEPDSTKPIQGELKRNILFIYDEKETDAWDTFTHEILEYKLKKITMPYRDMINGLIETFEKESYDRKEEVLESLPKVLKIIEELKPRD